MSSKNDTPNPLSIVSFVAFYPKLGRYAGHSSHINQSHSLMITTFHGTDEASHGAFQQWRREHVDGFHMTEGAPGMFTIHWTQDMRENPSGRGCNHQGGSSNSYREDKNGCYTTKRKVCSESLSELRAWATSEGFSTKPCSHCDTKRFPFPDVVKTRI